MALVICDVLTRTCSPQPPGPVARCTDDCPFALTGVEIRRLMRVHRWTIRRMADRLAVTLKRVRQMRAAGVTGHSACDWYEALTGALAPAMTAYYRARMAN